MKATVIEWWNGSVIKTYWDELVDWITNVWQNVKDWWNNTALGKWVNEKLMPAIANIADWLNTKIQNIKAKLANVSFNIPSINPDSSWRKPSTWFMWKTIHPFGFLAQKKTESGATKIVGATDNDEDSKRDVNNAKDIPKQQVQNAMSTVNSISNMKQETNIKLQSTGAEMS